MWCSDLLLVSWTTFYWAVSGVIVTGLFAVAVRYVCTRAVWDDLVEAEKLAKQQKVIFSVGTDSIGGRVYTTTDI